MSSGMRFSEAMVGTWRRPEGAPAACRFDIDVAMPELLNPLGTVSGTITGTVDAAGLGNARKAVGTIEISPVAERRIRYSFDFTGDDGAPYRFDGWKSIEWLRPLRTWTTLPGTIYGPGGSLVGTAELRFPLARTAGLVSSVRVGRLPDGGDPTHHHARRWDGRPGRLEVWYDTVTDPATGTGFWLHHELVAPTAGRAPHCHGWLGVFPPDEPPELVRFGPSPVGEEPWFACREVTVSPGRRAGRAGSASWDLAYELDARPLFTFPRLVWRRELLPAAQIVPSPAAAFSGVVKTDHRSWSLDGAPGAAARIYGHGNAERWGWLHADLGEGDVLEVVAAVPRRPGLNRLRPLPLVQLRLGGRDWPANPLLAAPGFRASLGLPEWTV
ncbi:MAG TPA: hypothetical protein VE152_01190, partial [Acidimicrobiales bacterium]|nr:hypothetical protein [Acidimicrobiales bacterium]